MLQNNEPAHLTPITPEGEGNGLNGHPSTLNPPKNQVITPKTLKPMNYKNINPATIFATAGVVFATLAAASADFTTSAALAAAATLAAAGLCAYLLRELDKADRWRVVAEDEADEWERIATAHEATLKHLREELATLHYELVKAEKRTTGAVQYAEQQNEQCAKICQIALDKMNGVCEANTTSTPETEAEK